jgi:hypothetical protein
LIIRDNLDLCRSDRVGLVFGRSIYRGRKNRTPGIFATRVVTDGVTPSLHVLYKTTKIKSLNLRTPCNRRAESSDKPSDYGARQCQTEPDGLRHRNPSDLR